MEFAEKTKEFTHKNGRSTKSKYMTSRSMNCAKCRGICIFSISFFEEYSKSTSFRKKLDEKFYLAEFEYLRSLENDEEETLTTFDLLRKFHSLEEKERNKVGKIHGSCGFGYRIEKSKQKLIKTSTKKYCYCSRCVPGAYVDARQKRKTNLILDNVCDITVSPRLTQATKIARTQNSGFPDLRPTLRNWV